MTTPALLEETVAFLHDRIPLTKAMGVGLESYDDRGLVLTAPLAACLTWKCGF